MDNLKTTICECGYGFDRTDIKPPLIKTPKNFYGNNVTRFSEAECECGRKYLLWLKPTGQSWRVTTMSRRDESSEQDQDIFESMERPELQAWLESNGVEYVKQWGDKRLRETARAWLEEQNTV